MSGLVANELSGFIGRIEETPYETDRTVTGDPEDAICGSVWKLAFTATYDALKAPKEYMLFTQQDGAEEHCQVGAVVFSNARILNWLDGVLK